MSPDSTADLSAQMQNTFNGSKIILLMVVSREIVDFMGLLISFEIEQVFTFFYQVNTLQFSIMDCVLSIDIFGSIDYYLKKWTRLDI